MSRKRPSEDLGQYARSVSRELKLRKVDQTQLQKVSVATPAEQRVFLTGLLLKIQEHQELMVAPDTTFQLSKKLEAFIKNKALRMLLDPSLFSYIDVDDDKGCGPAQSLYAFLEANPHLGFTTAMAEDASKASTMLTAIRRAFTRARSRIKEIIDASFQTPVNKEKATDIVVLTETLLALPKSKSIKITVQHCARFAFLRFVAALRLPNAKFWKKVDQELRETRAMGSAKKQSKFLADLLKKDRQDYGMSEGAPIDIEDESPDGAEMEDDQLGDDDADGEDDGADDGDDE